MKKNPIIVIALLTQSLLFAHICDRIQLNKLFPNSRPEFHSIAINDNCDAVAVWIETRSEWGGVGDPLVASFYSNGTWGPSTQIQSDITKGAQGTVEVIVDIDNNGNAAIAWYSIPDGTIYTSYHPAGGSWSTEVAALTGLSQSTLGLVTTLTDNSAFFTVVYSDTERRAFVDDSASFISYIQSTDKGSNWTNVKNIVTTAIDEWDSSRSDNKNIAIAWVIGDVQLIATTLIGSALSSPMIVDTAPTNFMFFGPTSFSIAINNSGNMASGFNLVHTINNREFLLKVSFFDNIKGSWPPPVTLIEEFGAFNVATFENNITLNNSNHALIVTQLVVPPISQELIFSSGENTPSTNNWQNITPFPVVFVDSGLIVCNDDNNNAVSFFDRRPPSGGGVPRKTEYRLFLGSSSSWNNANPLFNEIIAPTARSTSPHRAIDCKHASSNIAVLTLNLNTLVCCGGLFFASAPTNLSGSCALNRFPMQGEFFTTLNWNPPTGEAVAGYNVHRNGDLIATLPSTQLTFSDHNRPSDAKDTYSVSSIDNNGIVSSPAEITVNCTK